MELIYFLILFINRQYKQITVPSNNRFEMPYDQHILLLWRDSQSDYGAFNLATAVNDDLEEHEFTL
jgi:hypothetical protein